MSGEGLTIRDLYAAGSPNPARVEEFADDAYIAELAKAVELKEIEQSGADYQDLLKEIEGLSDDEVRALLAEEQDAT